MGFFDTFEEHNDERENMRILKFKTLIEEVSGMLTIRRTGLAAVMSFT